MRSKGREHGFMQISARGTCRATFQGGGASSGSSCDLLGEWDDFPSTGSTKAEFNFGILT